MTTLQAFIKKKPYLIWYTNNYAHLSNDSIVEAVLNYGDWDDVQKVFSILGTKKTAAIFKKNTTNRPWGRMNYSPDIKHYFDLYFRAHA